MHELILQREDALLLERVTAFGPDFVEAVARLDAEHPLAHERGIPCWVGIELMAQAISAFSGLELRARGKAPRIGLLLGTRRYVAQTPYFGAGVELRIRAQLSWRDADGLAVFDCVLSEGGRALARAQVKGFEPEDIGAYL